MTAKAFGNFTQLNVSHFAAESRRVIIRIHFRMAQSGHFQRLQYKCVPCKHTVVAKKGMTRIGGKVFLARGEVGGDVNLRPKSVPDGVIGFVPSVQLASDVSAYLNSQPASTVVVNPIHIVIGVVGAMFFADHGVPGAGEVIPTSTVLLESDENWAYRPT